MPFIRYTDTTDSDVEYESVKFNDLTSCYTYNPLYTAISKNKRGEKDENNFMQWIAPNEVIKFSKSDYNGYLDIIWIKGQPYDGSNEGTSIIPADGTIDVITKMNLQKYRFVIDVLATTLIDDGLAITSYDRNAQTYTKLLDNERIDGCSFHWENIENGKRLETISPVIRYIDENNEQILFYPHIITTLTSLTTNQSDGMTYRANVAHSTTNTIYLSLFDIDKKYNYPGIGTQYNTTDDDSDIAYMWYNQNQSYTLIYPTVSYKKFLEALALLGVYFRIGGVDYLGFMDESGQTTGEYLTADDWSKSAQFDSTTINNFKEHNPPYIPPSDKDDIEPVGYGYFSNTTMGTLYALKNKLDLEKITQWLLTQTEKIDIANNVVSLKEIPFPLSTLVITPIDTNLTIGGVPVTYQGNNVVVGEIVAPAIPTVSVVFADFDIPRLSNTFLDYSPYTKYELLVPFAPSPISLPDWCINKNVKAIFLYDIYTTACQYVIECNGERICSVSGNFGIDRPISAQNAALKDSARLSAQIGTASSVLGGVMSGATGNVGGIISGAIGGVSALSQMILSGKQNYMYTVGANGDSSTVGLYHAAHLKITRTLSAEDENFVHIYGKPLCKVRKLSSLSGYTKCDNVNTSGLTCSESEKQMIKNLLESGIHL